MHYFEQPERPRDGALKRWWDELPQAPLRSAGWRKTRDLADLRPRLGET
jgi:hypothetical protein